MNKKLIILFAATMLSFSLAACSEAPEANADIAPPEVNQAPEVNVESAPPEVNLAPEISETDEVADADEEMENNINNDNEDGFSAESVFDSTIFEVPMTPMIVEIDEILFQDLYGIDPLFLVDFKAIMPAMSGQITEITVVQVTNTEYLNEVTELMEARLEFIQTSGAFYPSHVEIAQNGKVVANGNYVLLAVDEAVDELVANFELALH